MWQGLRRVDALNARLGHLLSSLLLLAWVPFLVPEQRVRIWALGAQGALHAVAHALVLGSEGWLGAVTYQPCRVRDGRAGRVNVLLSECASLALLPLALYVLMLRLGCATRPAPHSLARRARMPRGRH